MSAGSRAKATRRQSGELLVTLSFEYHFELAHLVAMYLYSHGTSLPNTKTDVLKHIFNYVSSKGAESSACWEGYRGNEEDPEVISLTERIADLFGFV